MNFYPLRACKKDLKVPSAFYEERGFKFFQKVHESLKEGFPCRKGKSRRWHYLHRSLLLYTGSRHNDITQVSILRSIKSRTCFELPARTIRGSVGLVNQNSNVGP